MTPEEVIIKTNMNLKNKEKCLIVTDKNKISIAENIFNVAKTIADSEIIIIPIGKVNGEEPPTEAIEKILKSDVVIYITTKSLTHTNATNAAQKNGARIASMPGVTDDILNRCISVDYDWMKETTNKLADIMDSAKSIRITTELGTDITFDISERIAFGRNSGLLHESGARDNLPAGEAFIAPIEGTANGVYYVDASQAGIGRVDTPIKITVENGFATDISGGEEAENFKKMLDSINDKNAFNIAEVGIGTNPKAKITGLVIEDEKVFGTCHVALGKNDSFGGKINVPIHVDGVMNKPSIWIDEKLIMDKGILFL